MSKERRSSPRQSLHAAAVLKVPGLHPMRGRTLDVSSGGVSVRMDYKVPIETECSIAFHIHVHGRVHALMLEARVAYSEIDHGKCLHGLQFLEVPSRSRRWMR